jgi:signal transduction histidine kinase
MVDPRSSTSTGVSPFLAVATVAAMVVIAWSAARLSSTGDLDADGLGQLGAPDPEVSVLEEHLDWSLALINGGPISPDEFEQRFSPWFRSQITYRAFEAQTNTITSTAPYQLYGFQADDEAGQAEALLASDDGQTYQLSLVLDPDTDQLAGLLISEIEGVDTGAFSGWQFAVHAGAAVALLGAARLLERLGLGRSLHRAVPTMLAVAAVLWAVQLLEVSGSPIVFTLALLAGPLAAAILAASLTLAITTTSDSSKGPTTAWFRHQPVAVALAAIVVAGAGAVAAVTTLDTAAVGRPDNLLAIAPDRQRAEAAVALGGWLTLAAAVVVGAIVIVSQVNTGRAGRSLAPVAVGVIAGAGLWAVPAALVTTSTDGYDLSQSPLLSIGAIVAAVGLAGSAYWHRYDEGERADELAAENRQLHGELALQLAEVEASRARIVEAAEEARRSVERDLHDGAQQRLVALLLAIKVGRQRFGSLDPELDRFLASTADDLGTAVGELRELARGLRPAVLEHGVAAAAEALAEVSPVPTTVTADRDLRCSSTIEQTAYYVISESLTNAAKHADADHVEVVISPTTADPAGNGDGIECVIRDDGRGGATIDHGGGLQNIADRVRAAGGTWSLSSPTGGPTVVTATLPCRAEVA